MKVRTHTQWTIKADDYEIGLILTALDWMATSYQTEPRGPYELEAIKRLYATLDSRR